MITGNKGEWSEIYTLLKIISDKQLFAGDFDLNKIESLIFPIIKVLRDESSGTYEFSYENDLVVVKDNSTEFRIPVSKFQEQAVCLLEKLQSETSASFSIPDVEAFINSFNSQSIKAKSSIKSDIRVVIHDLRTGMTPELGFSIKSQLGSPSTLLNAGKTTNITYKLCVELTENQISQINALDTRSKIKDRLKEIEKQGGTFIFQKMDSQVFENNLILIDSCLPQIVADMVFEFFNSENSKISDLVKFISILNPLNYNLDNKHPFYLYKIKRLLTDIALGMMPATVWTGELDATGGYLVVKGNGDVLCYHIYNKNEFEDYLFFNTKLETASSTRHEFGTIYSVDDELFFKLNLQIRFV
ncbi:MAG: HpaII family restriction endonuclease [Dysgonamonadaceae bacterium]|jgi:type II restriction enzyme|nr:HpaII family restriction endonuclease [Dysgonamonadaceae bacterium]